MRTSVHQLILLGIIIMSSESLMSCGQSSLVRDFSNSIPSSDVEPSNCSQAGVPFGGGSGTESEPYLICHPNHLDQIRNNLNSHFALETNINMEGVDFSPIGSSTERFQGVLDGRTHSISNLTIQRRTEIRVGLFRQIGGSGSVKNLRINNCIVVGRQLVGCIAGLSYGLLQNLRVSGSIGDDSVLAQMIGGIVGRSSGTIADVSFDGDVQGGRTVGGIVGTSSNIISHCKFSGRVTGTSTVGGLSGSHLGMINQSVSNADVYARPGTTNPWEFGGLVGLLNSGSTIRQSSTHGQVNAPAGSRIGGLVGRLNFLPSSINQTLIVDNYSTGTVTGSNGVGGFAGSLDPRAVLLRNYARGRVIDDNPSTTDTGGFVGQSTVFDTVPVQNYWDRQTTEQNSSGNEAAGSIQGLSTAEMTTHNGSFSFFDSGWASFWSLIDGQYPRLH